MVVCECVCGGGGGVRVVVQKSREGVRSGWVRVVVYEELEVVENCKKKLGEGGGGPVEESGGRLVRLVLDEELKLLWKCQKKSGGQGGCERRIEVIVTMHKKEKKSGVEGVRVRGSGSGWM